MIPGLTGGTFQGQGYLRHGPAVCIPIVGEVRTEAGVIREGDLTVKTLPQFCIAHHSMGTNDKFWFGVPLVVCDEVPSLEPNPLLAFG